MVAIPTTAQLETANIDSLERLIVALGLYFSQQLGNLPSTSAISKLVTVSLVQRPVFDQETLETVERATINFVCNFLLESDTQTDGGELLNNISPFLTASAPTFPVTPASLETQPALLTIPEELTTAEQLMVWALLSLSASLHPNSRDFIQINPKYGEGKLSINCQLPADRQALGLSGFQLIAGVQRIAAQYLELDTGAVAAINQDAYEIAVDEGYLGTRAEWLASLVGPPGIAMEWKRAWSNATDYVYRDGVSYEGSSYIANVGNTAKTPGVDPEWDLIAAKGEPGLDPFDIAVAEGFPGTRAQWLESLQGEPGLDPFDIAVAEGFLGTRAEWLESLKGEPGEPGPPSSVTVLTADITYYVSPTGSDANTGLTSGVPISIAKMKTIASTTLTNGYLLTFYLNAGTYSTISFFDISASRMTLTGVDWDAATSAVPTTIVQKINFYRCGGRMYVNNMAITDSIVAFNRSWVVIDDIYYDPIATNYTLNFVDDASLFEVIGRIKFTKNFTRFLQGSNSSHIRVANSAIFHALVSVTFGSEFIFLRTLARAAFQTPTITGTFTGDRFWILDGCFLQANTTIEAEVPGSNAGYYDTPYHAYTGNTVVVRDDLSSLALYAPTIFTLTDAATITWNAQNRNAQVTLAGNRTLANPTNINNGEEYTLYVIQDGTGGRTLTYGSVFKWPGGTPPTLTTTPNAIDMIVFKARSGNLHGTFYPNYS